VKHRKDETAPGLGHFALWDHLTLFHTPHSASWDWPAREHIFSGFTPKIMLWWISVQSLHYFKKFKKIPATEKNQ